MALIDVRCDACSLVTEVYRPLAEWPKTPPCEKCGSPTTQVHLPRRTVVAPPATVVYKAPDGSFRFPGSPDPNSRTAKMYGKLGYERIEVSGWANVRRLEGQMNARERAEIEKRVERQCQFREESLGYRRSEIRQGLEQGFRVPEYDDRGKPTGRMKLVRMGPEARDLMRAAQERNYGKPGLRPSDPGIHIQAYSYNRSNRDESRAADGRRHRD